MYDSAKERFYYVSDLYNTTTSGWNSKYAVLIYYSNTLNGVADVFTSVNIEYDSSNDNHYGPRTAITNLPTTTQWSNVNLYNIERQIRNEDGGKTTTGGTLPSAFSYSGYAARLLTAQEVNKACAITVGGYSTGELDRCNFLMERTKYSIYDYETYGYWLELLSRMMALEYGMYIVLKEIFILKMQSVILTIRVILVYAQQ